MIAEAIESVAPQSAPASPFSSAAHGLGPWDRKTLSLQALAGLDSVADIARRRGVSRQFVYGQAAKAEEALQAAFDPPASQARVLFHLPVTKQWIRQFVVAQVLVGHTPFRGVQELLESLFDYRDISVATVHNIVQEAVAKARELNDAPDLPRIRVGAHDEIYQAGKPVLVGADITSTYCYLLSAEQSCDETTWGVHLLDLADRGLRPEYTIADGGRGLRAGQAAAWEGTPCHGDVFHAEYELGKLALYLENRATACRSTRQKLEGKMERAKKRRRGSSLSKRLAMARRADAEASQLASDIRLLADWVQHDILSCAGPCLTTRRELFDFVVEELRLREPLCPHRVRPVRRNLRNHRDDLLAFAGVLDERLSDIARQFAVQPFLVHAVCELHGFDQNTAAYWQRQAPLWKKLPGKFHDVDRAVVEAMAETPRASSIVENLNSRLRNYFFLRRHIGNGYLDLLRFFLNHRRFRRSDRQERVGKSPAQLLTGQDHPHWLELLGFQRFRRN